MADGFPRADDPRHAPDQQPRPVRRGGQKRLRPSALARIAVVQTFNGVQHRINADHTGQGPVQPRAGQDIPRRTVIEHDPLIRSDDEHALGQIMQ